jgi:hypothetical protein
LFVPGQLEPRQPTALTAVNERLGASRYRLAA